MPPSGTTPYSLSGSDVVLLIRNLTSIGSGFLLLIGRGSDNAPAPQYAHEIRPETLEAFRLDYNTFRPHSSLGYLTPAETEKGFYEQRKKKAG
ncbi:MAG: transposase [Armatimonadetes bacterium]|nr:transposase [Armatimonadota bacterium]